MHFLHFVAGPHRQLSRFFPRSCTQCWHVKQDTMLVELCAAHRVGIWSPSPSRFGLLVQKSPGFIDSRSRCSSFPGRALHVCHVHWVERGPPGGGTCLSLRSPTIPPCHFIDLHQLPRPLTLVVGLPSGLCNHAMSPTIVPLCSRRNGATCLATCPIRAEPRPGYLLRVGPGELANAPSPFFTGEN